MAYKDPADQLAATKRWQAANPKKLKESKRKSRQKHKAKIREYKKQYRADNPEQDRAMQQRKYQKAKERIKARRRLLKTGWTEEQVQEAIVLQEGCCWICGVKMIRGSLGYDGVACDHDHDTKARRGLLCIRCNLLEGVHKKSPISPVEWATREAEYKAHFAAPQ